MNNIHVVRFSLYLERISGEGKAGEPSKEEGTVVAMPEQAQTIYDLAGGDETISQLVSHFYNYVAADPDLSPIFPEDFTEIREKQYRFLTQFFGGPMLYTQVYGHPMMRARHQPHPVTPKRAEAWLRCMNRAMDDTGITGNLRQLMMNRLTLTAHHMVNTPDEQ